MAIPQIVCSNENATQSLVNAANILINLANTSGVITASTFGDSYAHYQQFTDMGNNYQKSVIQASNWAFFLARMGNRVNVTNYKGVGGDNFADMLARYQTDIIVPRTQAVLMNGGVNDFYADSRTGVDAFADVQEMLEGMLTNNQLIIVQNCPAQVSTRGNYSFGRTMELIAYNELLADYVETQDRIILIDVLTPSLDHSDNNDGGAIVGKYIGDDKIHYGIFGSYDIGRKTEEQVAPWFVKGSNTSKLHPLTTGDVGDINFNNFNATGGTAGTGMSGIVPSGWIAKRQSGEGTMVGSQNADTGFYQIAITKSVAGTESVFRIESNELKTFFNDGDTVSIKIHLSLTGGNEVLEVRAYHYNDNGVAAFFTVDNGRSINGFTPVSPMDMEDLVLTIAPTEILDAPLVNVKVFIDIRLKGDATSILTLPGIRHTIIPAP